MLSLVDLYSDIDVSNERDAFFFKVKQHKKSSLIRKYGYNRVDRDFRGLVLRNFETTRPYNRT
jgi:hypothetical protein